jgi:DNA end-binding protein Ku
VKSKNRKAVVEDVEEPGSGSGGNVIDLMAALKKSVEEKPAAKRTATRRKKSA